MVRCFEDENVIHVNGQINSLADIDTINFELALADISQIEKRLERLAKTRAKSKEEEARNLVSTIHCALCPPILLNMARSKGKQRIMRLRPPFETSFS